MKKLLTWLSKGSKIIKVFTYIYSGLVVAKSAISSALAALKEVKPDLDSKIVDILQQVVDYMDVAIDAIEKVLDWFGIDAKAVEEKSLKTSDPAQQLKEETQKLKELL